MSHFTILKTQFTDRDALVVALGDVGFPNVEVSDAPLPLFGWEGDVRPESAHVVIRREHISEESNDLGFLRNGEGVYEAIVSSYDRETYDEAWLGRVAQRYAYRVACRKLAEQGFTLVAEETEGQRIHLVLRRAV